MASNSTMIDSATSESLINVLAISRFEDSGVLVPFVFETLASEVALLSLEVRCCGSVGGVGFAGAASVMSRGGSV